MVLVVPLVQSTSQCFSKRRIVRVFVGVAVVLVVPIHTVLVVVVPHCEYRYFLVFPTPTRVRVCVCEGTRTVAHSRRPSAECQCQRLQQDFLTAVRRLDLGTQNQRRRTRFYATLTSTVFRNPGSGIRKPFCWLGFGFLFCLFSVAALKQSKTKRNDTIPGTYRYQYPRASPGRKEVYSAHHYFM